MAFSMYLIWLEGAGDLPQNTRPYGILSTPKATVHLIEQRLH